MSTEKPIETKLSFSDGMEAVGDSVQQGGEKKDLALCSVCLQWTCDGPQCHRPGVCED